MQSIHRYYWAINYTTGFYIVLDRKKNTVMYYIM